MLKYASIGKAKNALSSLVNDVAHGHERVVLTSRGRPKAAVVSLDDLAALEESPPGARDDESVLDDIKRSQSRILRRRKGALLSNSADDLAALREGE